MKQSSLDKATDDQLWCICQHDRYVPKRLLELIVIEGLNRGLFDWLIKHVMKKIIHNLHSFLFEANMSKEELMQIGRTAVYMALKNYSDDRDNTFNTFAFINIKSGFIRVIETNEAEKRKVYKRIKSLDYEVHDDNEDNEYYYLKDFRHDTEKEALFNIEWEQALSLLNEREKKIIQYLVKGYTLGEMAPFFNIKASSRSYLHRLLHNSFKKINPNAPKIDLHELGLVYRNKEQYQGQVHL